VKWTVVWLPEAQDDLARLWLAATDQKAITQAADWIDKALRQKADKIGIQSLDGRFLEKSPLSVAYDIRPDDCLVRVLQVVLIV
jgi:plasmid stabilization system protein ParE